MFVLLDMEWIQTEKRHLTQLAAARVDKDWNELDHFEAVSCPPENCLQDAAHMSLSGYPLESFQRGEREDKAIERLGAWLQADDVICVWNPGSGDMLEHIWKNTYQERFPYRIVCANQTARDAAFGTSGQLGTLYDVCEFLKLPDALPRHCSKNDVLLLERLFSSLGLSQEELWNRCTHRETRSRAEKNREIVQKAKYHYIYTPDSSVFHTPSCPCMRNAVSLNGCIRYKTAVRTRRPCRICKPNSEIAPAPKIKNLVRPRDEKRGKQIIITKLMEGRWARVCKEDVVGCCQYKRHPGDLTASSMYQQNCLAKNCRYSQRYESRPFWARKRKKQTAKGKGK